jgi:hypothetical protein
MQLMDHYFEAGGSVFDTAEFYALDSRRNHQSGGDCSGCVTEACATTLFCRQRCARLET